MTPDAIVQISEAGRDAILVFVLVAVGLWINRYTARQQDFVERLVQQSSELTMAQIRAMEDMASAIRETGQALQTEHVTIITEMRGLRGGLKRNAS